MEMVSLMILVNSMEIRFRLFVKFRYLVAYTDQVNIAFKGRRDEGSSAESARGIRTGRKLNT